MLFSYWSVIGWSFLSIIVLTILFFILMAEKVIKRTDRTVRIERFIEAFIGFFLRFFFWKAGNLAASGIENSHLKFRCRHCGYSDDVKRNFCLNCLKDEDGFYVEHVLPFQCKHCFSRFSKSITHCEKCDKNQNEVKGSSLL